MDGHQLYINLVEHLPFGLMIWQLDDSEDTNTFRLLAVNPMARRILGLPASETTNSIEPCVDPFPAFLKIEPPEVYADIVRSGIAKDLGEIRYRNDQAVETICLAKAFPLPQQQVGVLFEDVTERRQAEEALRQLEQKLLFHWRQTPLAVIEWDTQFSIVEWNPAAEKIFGYSRREVLGQHTVELIVSAEFRAEVQAIWERSMKLKLSVSRLIQNITHTERRISCEWHCTPLLDEGKQVIGMLSLVQDVTDRRRAEIELRQFAERLAQSNRELQDFASVASHDLQEPLRKIQAFGDRLYTQYRHILPEQGQDYLQRMQNAAQRMQTLINDLLALSRIGTEARSFAPVSLTTIVQDVLLDLEVRIQQTGAAIEVADLPTINADPIQMRQLLQNLISNALKFHQTGVSPHVQIRSHILSSAPNLTADASDQAVCQIQVIDNGIGFDEKYLDRIFTIFQRLHGRNEYEGTGVGLAICRKIVERHGGSITAHSVPGQGATFVVTLPLHSATHLDRKNLL
ncbi:MAG: hypothetical protein Kow00121_19430 [Elainellaceae cyanobacterium]